MVLGEGGWSTDGRYFGGGGGGGGWSTDGSKCTMCHVVRTRGVLGGYWGGGIRGRGVVKGGYLGAGVSVQCVMQSEPGGYWGGRYKGPVGGGGW